MRRTARRRLKEEETLIGSNVCWLCKEEPDEGLFGKFFVEEESGFSVHQYCMFFSSGLAQTGEDTEGFDGFLIKDIKKEISRAKRLRCNFCKKQGATIGCCEAKCNQTFHYKCGRERGSLFQFFDSFNSFCLYHRPTQHVNLAQSKNQTCPICWCEIEWDSRTSLADVPLVTPCCKKSWFHNSCLQRHAQSSGLYYFRCPVCNDVEKFQAEMKRMGIFIPEQDASWEKDDAFADLLFQYSRCDAQNCVCPYGREHKGTSGCWRIRLCDTCGQFGTHLKCQHWKSSPEEWHCDVCGNTLPYSSTRGRPVGDHSMDPYISDEDQSSSSADDCEVNVCTVSDDDAPLASLKRNQEELQLRSSVAVHVREGASPMRKRRRLSRQGTPSKAGTSIHKENHLMTSPTCANSVNDLSYLPSVLFVISDAVGAHVYGGATMTEEANIIAAPVNVKTESEAIVIRDTDSECASVSDDSVEDLKIDAEVDKDKGNTKSKKDDANSKSIETVYPAKVKSPRKSRQNLANLKPLKVEEVVEAEADSSAVAAVAIEREDPMFSEVNLLNFENKESDDDSCLITKVVKKPCPVGNDKFGKCFLRCCNPAGFFCFCPDVIATSFDATICTCKDLQIQTVSSTSSCIHVREKSGENPQQNLPSATTNAATEDDANIGHCSIGTNTMPFKPSTRKYIQSRQTKITNTYFPRGKTPVSPSGQNRRLNLRSKRSGSCLERSLEKFCSLREHHMTVSHKCFR